MQKTRFFQFLTLFILLTFPLFLNAQPVSLNGQSRREYTQALYLIGSDQYNQAMNTLVRIIGQRPSMPEAYIKLAMLYSKKNEPEKGVRFFEKLLESNPDDAYACRALGWIYFNKKQYQKSAEQCLQAVELKPDYAGGFNGYLNAMHKLDKLDEAAKYLKDRGRKYSKTAAFYYALGYLDQLQGNWQKALGNLNRALDMEKYLFEAYVSKGAIYFYIGKYQDLLQTSRMGLNRSKERNNPEGQSNFLGNIGLAYLYLANYSLALNYSRQALELAQKIGSKKEVIRNLNNMGAVNQNWGKMAAALANFQNALTLAKHIGDRRQEGLLLRNIGSIYRLTDEYQRALSYFNRSLPILNEAGEKRMEGLVYWSMSLTHWNFGNYTRALELSQKAYTIAENIGDKWGEERYGGTIGLINWSLGRYSRAFDHYEIALAQARESRDRVGEELWLGNLAILFDELGDSSKAFEYYEKALIITRNIGNKRAEARQIGNMAALYEKLGNHEQALNYYNQALKIEGKIRNRKDQTVFLNDVAVLYHRLGDLKKSEQYAQKALQTAKEIGSKRGEGNAYIALGYLNYSVKNYPLASKYYKKALRIGKAARSADMVWRSNAGLARVYSRQRRYEKSLGYSEKAIQAIEKIRATVPTEKYRTGFLETKLDVYDQAIHLLAELHRRFPSRGYDRKSFELAEKAKARSLLDMVYQGRVFQILKEIPSNFRERFLINEKQLNNAYQKLSDEHTKPTAKQNKAFISRLSGAVDSLKRVKSRITTALREKYPEYYRLTNPTLLNVQDVQTKIIRNNQILIEYWVGRNETYIWIIGKNKLKFKTIDLSRKELQKKLARISPLFAQEKDLDGITIDHRWADINPKLLNELYLELLGKPAGKFIKNAGELIIVPDDLLFYLPFEILVTRMDRNAIRYLIEDYPISYTPSASLRNPGLRRTGLAKNDLLAFGNPDFSTKEERQLPARISLLGRYRPILRSGRLLPLPNAALEVKAIAKNFSKTAVFTGKWATEMRFKRMAGEYRLIHLATHFQIDDEHPWYSKIILAQSEKGNEDGYLKTYEIYNMRLHADMIVLSGCNSGLGKLSHGEGIIGMTRAFLYAGVPNMVVSLWPVEDRSTALLMKNFYRYLTKGFNKARALQKAKIDLIQSKDKKRDPFYWAPFVLISQ